MREEWEKYLLSKVELQALPKFNKKKPKAPKGLGILDGVIPSVSGQKAEVSSISKHENDALLAAANKISKLARGDTDRKDGVASEKHVEERKDERKKKKPMIGKPGPESETNIQPKTTISKRDDKVNDQNTPIGEYLDNRILRKHDQGPENAFDLQSVHFHALESDQNVLDFLQPSVVIVYHPDIAFVREIEIYKAENPSKRLRVYFLFYEDSTEVQKYEASVRRENGAFESLIRQKSLMMMPVGQVCYSALLY